MAGVRAQNPPAACPTCSTVIPEGAVRCPGCGRVFGEDNRCPHCHAIAAVKPTGEGYTCIACGNWRDRLPGTTVLGEPDARMSLMPATAPATRLRTPLEVFGAAALVAGALAAVSAVPLFAISGLALVLALAAAAAGLGGGAAMIAAGRRQLRERVARLTEQRILALAKRQGGDLTVGDVVAALRISTTDADAALTRMSDGTRITAEVDESAGVLHFVFHELKPEVPKTRVEVEEEREDELDSQATAKEQAKQ